MTKARRELAALLPSQDVVIEVLDARLPQASSNPVISELRGAKPCIKVLAKSDLADPAVTRAWLLHLETKAGVAAFASTTARPQVTRKRIAELCHGLARHRGPDKSVRALIVGVPNTGKSTLFNMLTGRTVAKVGDKPAVTKEQQTVTLENGTLITDSPGLMWPKIENETEALRLALAGSIPDSTIGTLAIGMFGAQFLIERCAGFIVARYKLSVTPPDAESLLSEIGRKRGGLRKGGIVDLHKAAEILVHEFRTGLLGPISLEEPQPAPLSPVHPGSRPRVRS